jgi:hypothetical protein
MDQSAMLKSIEYRVKHFEDRRNCAVIDRILIIRERLMQVNFKFDKMEHVRAHSRIITTHSKGNHLADVLADSARQGVFIRPSVKKCEKFNWEMSMCTECSWQYFRTIPRNERS